MFSNGLFSWFSSSKQEEAPATWDANTATVQAQQPARPDAPNMDGASEQPKSQEEMKLRGGGGGDICCGVCAGLLCFECCEECC